MENGTNTQAGSYDDMKRSLGMDVAEAPVETPQDPTPEEPVEEPTEETQEPVAETTDEPTDTAPTEGAQEEQGGDDPTQTIFDRINKEFETEFKDESELRNALSSTKRIGELEEQVKEIESLKEENLLLKENLDPRKYFESDDDFKVQMFKKQFPDKDAATAYNLFTKDIGQMKDTDVLAAEMMLDNPGLDKSTVMELINDKYGIEDGEELERVAAAKITVDANKARKTINALKNDVKLPDAVNVESLAAQQKELLEQKKETLKKGWTDVAKEVSRTLEPLTFTEKDSDGTEWTFKYDISQDFPEDVTDNMVEYMANNGQELSKEAASTMAQAMKQKYVADNLPKIVKAVRDDVSAKLEEKRLKKQHNPGAPKADSAPSKDKKSDVNQSVLSALEGQSARTTFLDNN